MYSLLSVLAQREVGEMREGPVRDGLPSQMPHFMGYFLKKTPPQNVYIW